MIKDEIAKTVIGIAFLLAIVEIWVLFFHLLSYLPYWLGLIVFSIPFVLLFSFLANRIGDSIVDENG
jgi:ABC-type polysaccharide/polyol phosphate export permease